MCDIDTSDRRALSVLPPGCNSLRTRGFPTFSEEFEQSSNAVVSKKRKRTKGFDGEIDPNVVTSPTTANGALSPEVRVSRSPNAVSVDGSVNPLFTTQRMVDTIKKGDGSVEMHVTIECTLRDIAEATNLRVEDAAFALHECGLLIQKLSDAKAEDQLVISGAMVEKVAAERKVKEPCMDLSHVLL
jgi:histone acetyltransferase HTATIP/histone acetyltransferase MYST1